MPEVIIKYKGARALKALNDFAKYFDFVVQHPKSKSDLSERTRKSELPIVFAESPDVTSLAGIWKGRDISLNELRQKAWGNRI